MSKKSKKCNKLLIVKIGSEERPASVENIKDMKKKLKKIAKKRTSLRGYDVIVTHHAVDFDFINL